MAVIKSLSVITLNVNGLNSPLKRHRVGKYIKNTRLKHMLTETHFSFKDTHRLKVERWKKNSMQTKQKRARMAILLSNKINSK